MISHLNVLLGPCNYPFNLEHGQACDMLVNIGMKLEWWCLTSRARAASPVSWNTHVRAPSCPSSSSAAWGRPRSVGGETTSRNVGITRMSPQLLRSMLLQVNHCLWLHEHPKPLAHRNGKDKKTMVCFKLLRFGMICYIVVLTRM